MDLKNYQYVKLKKCPVRAQESNPPRPAPEIGSARERGGRLHPPVRRAGRGLREAVQVVLRQPYLLPQRAGRDRQPGKDTFKSNISFELD